MKYLISITLLSLMSVFQLLSPPKPKNSEKSAQADVLHIYVNDLTESNSWLPLVSKNEIFALNLSCTGQYAHFQLAGVCITPDSRRQIPFISEKVDCELLTPTGNLYRQSAIRQENEKKCNRIKIKAACITDSLMHYIGKPRNMQHTDINGALLLTRQICAPFENTNTEIKVILISDCLQDLPGGGQLKPIVFPPNVTIYVIGKSEKVALDQLFPSNKVVEIPALKSQFLQ